MVDRRRHRAAHDRGGRRTGLYDGLEVAEAVAFLEAQPPRSVDLVVAADVFVYLGDLAPVFGAVARALTPQGLCAFSLESREGEGFGLVPSMRFKHSLAHVREALADAGLAATVIAARSARREAGVDVPGWLALAVPAPVAPAGSPR